MKRSVLGLVEKITIIKNDRKKTVNARIDTGATKSSIDSTLARELDLGPIIKKMQIRSSHGTSMRPIIHAEIIIDGRTYKEEFTLAPRSHMSYPVLIGQNILKKGKFLVDPLK